MSSRKLPRRGLRASPTIVFLNGLVSSCSAYVDWIYPDPQKKGDTYNYIDTVYFTWTSNITDLWMNLWCAPNSSTRQSQQPLYHAQQPTNGTNPRSFPYNDYKEHGLCHMQLENLAEDDFANTPDGAFAITSNDDVAPETWGLSYLSLLGGSAGSTMVAFPSTTSVPSTPSPPSSTNSSTISSSTPASDSSSASSAPPTPLSLPSKTLTPAAEAGISIGAIFSTITLIIAILLFRIVRSRRTRSKVPEVNKLDDHQDGPVPEIGEEISHELGGRVRPSELQGVPRAELGWTPRVEVGFGAER